MPHTTDKRIRKDLARLLYLGKLQATDRRPALDPLDRGQLAFQALLFDCLMSRRDRPHPLEEPRKSAMASISGYLNVICHRPRHLEIHTNTAYRVASRLLPFRHEEKAVCGIPGLRLINYTDGRVRLFHVPTGARLDLVDWHRWQDKSMVSMLFKQETRWHEAEGRAALWLDQGLSEEEAAHQAFWAYTSSTPLRSALLMRSMPLWYRFDLDPAWVPGHGTAPDRLVWDAHPETDHEQVVELLTRSVARIPGARYHTKTPTSGTLELGGSSAELISKV
ncbi:hypothetical protein [Streptomyces sp. NPDC058202]|uniref:hypothetical protein n=1 Tax=Streptomyces sp. NPDC058202 TaxID=3346380 RepID=UPI0036E932E1